MDLSGIPLNGQINQAHPLADWLASDSKPLPINLALYADACPPRSLGYLAPIASANICLIWVPADTKLSFDWQAQAFHFPASGTFQYLRTDTNGHDIYQYLPDKEKIPRQVIEYHDPNNTQHPDWEELQQMQLSAENGAEFSEIFLREKLTRFLPAQEISRLFTASIRVNTLTPLEAYTKCCALLGSVAYNAHLYIPAPEALYWALTQSVQRNWAFKQNNIELIAYYLDRIHKKLVEQSNLYAQALAMAYQVADEDTQLFMVKTFGLIHYKVIEPNVFHQLANDLGYITDIKNFFGKTRRIFSLELARWAQTAGKSFYFPEFAAYFPELYRQRKNFLPSEAARKMSEHFL